MQQEPEVSTKEAKVDVFQEASRCIRQGNGGEAGIGGADSAAR
jgi:hypothetical protein